MRLTRFLLCLSCAVAGVVVFNDRAVGQGETAPGRVTADLATTGQGQLFSSVEAGLSVQLPPGNLVDLNDLQDPQVLAVVTNPNENWRFELRKLILDQPRELMGEELPEGGRRTGLLEQLAAEATRSETGELVRAAPIPLGEADAGLIVARIRIGAMSQLRQEALIQVDPLLYYRLILISPAPNGELTELGNDPAVQRAVEAFNTTLNSFKALDQTALREEQEERLLHTRSMLVNLKVPSRIAEASTGEQWWRIRRQGEDIGFARVIEEAADGLPSDIRGGFSEEDRRDGTADPLIAKGVRVGIRLRMRTGDGSAVDRRTWMYASREMDLADFRETNALFHASDQNTGAAAAGTVIGQMRSRLVPKRYEIPSAIGLGTEVVFDMIEQRQLDVTYAVGMEGEDADASDFDARARLQLAGDPLVRQLPAWFVPQAVDHLLPRLVAPWGEKKYLIAVYAPDRREVWSKYIDVAPPRTVRLPGDRGERLVLIVTTRLGLNGDATRHFIDSQTYEWLGSVTDATATEVWPCDREEIEEVWRDTPLLQEEQAAEAAGE